ncbi:DNA polymerase IV [Aestuariivirga litoralis]|uniref:DNA polymerase IV n=1 Tax=Aestuariivirga litoralis TaxID=2650924 RepID=UPI001AEEF124|nr:DNA polymerase IV [Aestuariivirga litoralis]
MTESATNSGFCRDCFTSVAAHDARCPACKSPRLLRHTELFDLSIAHIDCDAFYAAVEKRDNPELRDKPVIVGGGTRGVVSTACYIARIHGVKSAMPMFKALKLCPDAVVVKPRMAKYVEVGKQVRELMLGLTPMVQPVSIDEAFLDLTGTTRLHGAPPALSLARLARRIEDEIGVTVSVGLSHNKFLAKMASDLQKPRGFSVVGAAEMKAFLATKPVGNIWGVGAAMQASLAKRGITLISQLQTMEKIDLMRDFGSMGARLYHLSRGEDFREVDTHEVEKSISAETTFNEDIADYEALEAKLWDLCQRVSRRAKKSGHAGKTITLKLKTKDFVSRTRARSVADATNLAHVLFDAGKQLLRKETGHEKFRLIGIGISRLEEVDGAPDNELDSHRQQLTKAEKAIDKIREKFGNAAVDRGIHYKDK